MLKLKIVNGFGQFQILDEMLVLRRCMHCYFSNPIFTINGFFTRCLRRYYVPFDTDCFLDQKSEDILIQTNDEKTIIKL